jgi:hypothetical protein
VRPKIRFAINDVDNLINAAYANIVSAFGRRVVEIKIHILTDFTTHRAALNREVFTLPRYFQIAAPQDVASLATIGRTFLLTRKPTMQPL